MNTSPNPHPIPPSGSALRASVHKALAVSGLVASLLAVAFPVHADELADVNKAVRAGQYPDALAKADAFLAKHPKDLNMRFLKGVILNEQNKSAEAIAVFTKLTEDYPDRPEPYNNLAVLFAGNGQYDKARLALDNAIRTNPAYATAYENLGDVHARLASQAYDKALQLEPSNASAKSKLTMLRSLTGSTEGKVQTATGPVPTPAPVAVAPAPAPVPTPAPVAKPPVVAAVPAPAPAPTPAPAVTKPPVAATPAPAPTPTPVPAVARNDAKPDVKPDTKAAAKQAADIDTDDILTAVHGWAKAWSDQDVKSYLAYYGNDFETPKGESRKDWADERRDRIEGKSRIEVKVDSPVVNINGNTATVKFRQIYTSDRLKADSRKTLTLTKQNGKWVIKQERAGS